MTGEEPFLDGHPSDVEPVRPYLGRPRPNGYVGPKGSAIARPFLQTRGRVVADTDLPIEAQVVSTTRGIARHRQLSFERGDIVKMCIRPLSVAEVAASLNLHLGVVRVLVTDLSADGDLAVHEAPVDASYDVNTLLRVIRGLQAIS
ncbi:DUF742 domain-containing protein [Actinophytocola sp.]|uniref:DUF742 domain-containing protein n=1 Tax=Actinophytocola sp. TaxID=1872138 RepID=UPI003D6AF117